AHGETQVNIQVLWKAEALIQQSRLFEQVARESQADALDRFNFQLLALLEVAQILGAQPTWPRNPHIAILKRLLQWCEDIAGELNAAIQQQNISSLALLQTHVARLCMSHHSCCSQQV